MNTLLDWCLDKAESRVWQWGVKLVGVVICGGLIGLAMTQLPTHSQVQQARSVVMELPMMDDWDKAQAEFAKLKGELDAAFNRQLQLLEGLQRTSALLEEQIKVNMEKIRANAALQKAAVVAQQGCWDVGVKDHC